MQALLNIPPHKDLKPNRTHCYVLAAQQENFGGAGGAFDKGQFVLRHAQMRRQRGAHGGIGQAAFGGGLDPNFKTVRRFLQEFFFLLPRMRLYF